MTTAPGVPLPGAIHAADAALFAAERQALRESPLPQPGRGRYPGGITGQPRPGGC